MVAINRNRVAVLGVGREGGSRTVLDLLARECTSYINICATARLGYKNNKTSKNLESQYLLCTPFGRTAFYAHRREIVVCCVQSLKRVGPTVIVNRRGPLVLGA